MDPLLATQGMTDQQRAIFLLEYGSRKKDTTIAVLLTLLLGGFGAQNFYLGHIWAGILSVLFSWTFIPLLLSFVDLFAIPSRVRRHNERVAREIAARIRALSTSTGTSPTPPPAPAGAPHP